MKKYLFPCVLFLANSEILSLLALLAITLIFLADLARVRMEKEETWKT